VNLSALDPLVEQLAAQMRFYTELRQLLARGEAIGAEIPPEVFEGSPRPPIGEERLCQAPGCTNTFVSRDERKKFCCRSCAWKAAKARRKTEAEAGGPAGTDAVARTPTGPQQDADFTAPSVPPNGANGEGAGHPFGS
jgi:hypothetical protein